MWHNLTNYTDNFDLNITDNSSDLNKAGIDVGKELLLAYFMLVLFVLFVFYGIGFSF